MSLSVDRLPAVEAQNGQAASKSFLEKHGKKILAAVVVLTIAAVAIAILANPPLAATLGLAAMIAKFSCLASASTALAALPVIKVASVWIAAIGLSALAGSAVGHGITRMADPLQRKVPPNVAAQIEDPRNQNKIPIDPLEDDRREYLAAQIADGVAVANEAVENDEEVLPASFLTT
jgi:hypothetical protein